MEQLGKTTQDSSNAPSPTQNVLDMQDESNNSRSPSPVAIPNKFKVANRTQTAWGSELEILSKRGPGLSDRVSNEAKEGKSASAAASAAPKEKATSTFLSKPLSQIKEFTPAKLAAASIPSEMDLRRNGYDGNIVPPNGMRGIPKSYSTYKPQSSNFTGEKRRGKKEGDLDYDNCNLIVNYLPPDMDEVELRRIFKTHGPIDSVKIVRDLKSGRSKGYGFVRYHSADHANNAIRVLNGLPIRGKKLKVALARPHSHNFQDTNVFVSRLPPHFSDKQLHDIFKGFGKLVECRVLRDSQGNSRGTGFVRMDTHENALKAISQVNGKVLGGGSHAIEARLASTGRSAFRYSQIRNKVNGWNMSGPSIESIESMKTMEQMFRTQAAASLANMAMFQHAMMTAHAPFVGMMPGMPPMAPHHMGYAGGQGYNPNGMQGFTPNGVQQWNGNNPDARPIMDHPQQQQLSSDPAELAKLFNGMAGPNGPPQQGGKVMRYDRNGNPRLPKDAPNPMMDMFARLSTNNPQIAAQPAVHAPPGYSNYPGSNHPNNTPKPSGIPAEAPAPQASGPMPQQNYGTHTNNGVQNMAPKNAQMQPGGNWGNAGGMDFLQMERDIAESLLPENLI